MNNEVWLLRTISLNSGSCVQLFCDSVRKRDGKCLITGRERASPNNWTGLKAAYIFPLAQLGHWIQHDYSRWITILPPSGEPINSVQNGLLLRADIYVQFDNYFISINPDVRIPLIIEIITAEKF